MTPERFQEIDEILQRTLARPTAERAAFLDEVCDGDGELRREVASLLTFDEASDFLDQPLELDPDLGRQIGPYETIQRLGRGGMGAVYLAVREGEFAREVALKLIKRGMDSEDIVRRFLSERQILAELDHPRIARLYDGGTTDDGRPYFVMEHIEGEPLGLYCDTHRLTVRRRLGLFLEICSAVQAAHQHLVVHCDLKPGNILVDASGAPKLLDFGIAKLLGPGPDAPALTVPGRRPLTLGHASPEQVRGERLTTASDIYSLGVLLYQLLSGHLPSRLALVEQEEPPRPSAAVRRTEEIRHADGTVEHLTPQRVSAVRGSDPGRLRRHLTGDLDAIVLRAMRREPTERYGSVEQLAEDVRRHLTGRPVAARRGTFSYRSTKFLRRNRLALAAAAIFLVLVGSFILILSSQLRSKARVSDSLVGIIKAEYPATGERDRFEVKTALDKSRKSIDEIDDPEEQAVMKDALGRAYRNLGFYGEAMSLLGDSYAIRENLEDDSLLAESVHNIAYGHFEQGDYEEAKKLLLESLAMGSSVSDIETLDDEAIEQRATGLNVLGMVYQKQGKIEDAEDQYREALKLRRRLQDEEHSGVLRTSNNLATLFIEQGKYEEADKILLRSLEIRFRRLGPESESVATNLSQMSMLRYKQGRLEDAEAFLRWTLGIREGVHGRESPQVVGVLTSLGEVVRSRGRLHEAEEIQRDALAIQLEIRRDSPMVDLIKTNLAAVLEDLGRVDEAEQLLREAPGSL